VASNKRPECIEQVLDLSILVMSIMVVASSSARESIIHPPVIARRKLNKRERCPSGTCQEARDFSSSGASGFSGRSLTPKGTCFEPMRGSPLAQQ
jgi:hypothetical protein